MKTYWALISKNNGCVANIYHWHATALHGCMPYERIAKVRITEIAPKKRRKAKGK